MCEKKFAKITFAESLQWPVCNCLLCNIKDSSHSVIPCFLNSKCGEFFCDKSLNRMCCCVCVSAVYIVFFFFFLAIMHKLQSTEDSSAWLVVCIRSAENSHFSIQHKNLVTSRSLCCNQHKQTDICSVFDPMNVVYILLLVCSSFTIIQKTLNWGPCYFPSLLDYCNALLSGALVATFDKLQRSQNNLTRVVCQSRCRTDARPLLHSLHWLPVRQRVTYKLAVLTHKVRTNATPTYLSELIQTHAPSWTLRSSDAPMLVVPCIHTELAHRTFSVAVHLELSTCWHSTVR